MDARTKSDEKRLPILASEAVVAASENCVERRDVHFGFPAVQGAHPRSPNVQEVCLAMDSELHIIAPS